MAVQREGNVTVETLKTRVLVDKEAAEPRQGPGGVGRCSGPGWSSAFCSVCCACPQGFGSRGWEALPLPQSLMAGSSYPGAGARGQDSC